MEMFSFGDKYVNFGSIVVDNQFILEYMPMASGEAIKVYLYGLMACTYNPKELSMGEMCHDLGMERTDAEKALRYWERVGLVEKVSDREDAFRFLHANQAAFLGSPPSPDEKFAQFSEAVYAVFGNDYHLHGKEIIRYYEWVEDLGLPQEVVLMLIRHMISIRGKNFSLKAAEKMAIQLKESHVMTIEDAENALNRSHQVTEGARSVLRRFHIRREPTEDELDLYQKWAFEMGFSKEAILEACQETTSAQNPSFRYLDRILENMLQTGGAEMKNAQSQRARREKDHEMRESLKSLLYLLGHPGLNVNEGTLGMYQEFRALYDDPIIMIAGKECGRTGKSLEDVGKLLESWKGKGLESEAQIEEYIEFFRNANEDLRRIFAVWGVESRPGEANRKLLQTWEKDMHMPMDMILACAEEAKSAKRPMDYLGKILKECDQKGIHTLEGWQQYLLQRRNEGAANAAGGVPSARSGKTVIEQQFEQRPNTEHSSTDVPEWLGRYGEEQSNAQGNIEGSDAGI